MIKFEKLEVVGWEHAIRGMRNPMNSWDKSDSNFSCENCDGCLYANEAKVVDRRGDDNVSVYIDDHPYVRWDTIPFNWCNHTAVRIGPNDLALMKKLRNGGPDHGKFMRKIIVYLDITAPLYWWKEYDTYKVGTVANSCSTMHKIHSRKLELEDFSTDRLIDEEEVSYPMNTTPKSLLIDTIFVLNILRERYLQTKDKKYWDSMIQLLPTSYNQKRTVMLNYEVLRNIYRARKNHKLKEWHDLCDLIETLPYSELITGPDEIEREIDNEQTD